LVLLSLSPYPRQEDLKEILFHPKRRSPIDMGGYGFDIIVKVNNCLIRWSAPNGGAL
jgi:hypothetical protein